jgi:hypothetical protein
MILGRFGSAGFCSAAGEMTKVTQTFQPSGRCNSFEFLVAFEVQVALMVFADLKDVADLRSDADNPRPCCYPRRVRAVSNHSISTHIDYLTTLRLRGCDGSGAAGESAKDTQTVKPSGRFSGAKSR